MQWRQMTLKSTHLGFDRARQESVMCNRIDCRYITLHYTGVINYRKLMS
jgi:hypothetical protein